MKSGLSYDKGVFKQLADAMAKRVEYVENTIEFQLINAVGPMTVVNAREKSTFQDQTGNLRSSMGFVLAKDGKILETGGFTQVQGNGENMAIVSFKTKEGKEVNFHAKGISGDGHEGLVNGKQYAEELARNAGKGYVLIIVAGMNYAGYVESKGFDVLTQTGTYLESEVKTLIDDVLKKAGFK